MGLLWQNNPNMSTGMMSGGLDTSTQMQSMSSVDPSTAFGCGLGLGLGISFGNMFTMPSMSGDMFQGGIGLGGMSTGGMGIPSSTLMLMQSINTMISSVLAGINEFVAQLIAGDAQRKQSQAANRTQNTSSTGNSQASQVAGSGSGAAAANWGLQQEGKDESDSNWMNFVTNGNPNQPWCAYFVNKAFEEAGTPAPWGNTAYVPAIVQWGKDHNRFFMKNEGTPKVGDAVIFSEAQGATNGEVGDHIGIVTAVNSDGTIDTIEGNKSNAVKKGHYDINGGWVYGFVRT